MSRKQKKMLVRIIVTAVLFAGLFVFEKFVPITSRILRLAVYMVPYFVISYDILKKAFKGIIKGQVFDENFLMAVASVGAVAIAVYENGSYNEAVAVMLFYQIGELFQSYAVGKSRRSISELMEISRSTAKSNRLTLMKLRLAQSLLCRQVKKFLLTV